MRVPTSSERAQQINQLPIQKYGNSPIFTVRHMSSRVTSVTEYDNYGQTPHMYLIRGEDRIVLVDTGVGTGDLRSFIQSHANPANLPIFVVNSHCHFDHIACNFQFSVPPGDAVYGCLGIGVSGYDKEFTSALLERAFRDGEGEIPPLPRFNVTKWLKDGEKIVLSDRNPRDALEVLLLPGHCPDELALYDPLDRRLYVGDIIYRYFPICIFSEGSNFDQFETSIDRLIDFVNARDGFNPKSPIMLSAGHVDEELLSFYLVELKTLLERMRKKEIEPEQLTDHIAGYERGSVLWITVNTVSPEQLTPYDVAVATGAIEPFTKPRNTFEASGNGWMNTPLGRNGKDIQSKTFRARVGHKCRYM